MKVRQTIKAAAACLAIGASFASVVAQAAPALVEFDRLGQPLDVKKLSPKDKAALKKLGIDGEAPLGAVRVVSIAGGSGQYVIELFCNASANGKEETCELVTIGSLTTAKAMASPTGDPFVASSSETTGATGDSRYLTNGKGELQSLVHVETNAKKVKGKKTCDSRGSVVDFDANTMKLVVRVSKKPLGDTCQAPDKLFSKALSD